MADYYYELRFHKADEFDFYIHITPEGVSVDLEEETNVLGTDIKLKPGVYMSKVDPVKEYPGEELSLEQRKSLAKMAMREVVSGTCFWMSKEEDDELYEHWVNNVRVDN